MVRVAAVTGAYGFLGSRIRHALEQAGWQTVAFVREPRPGDRAVAWTLGGPFPGSVGSVSALVHCAYDMTVRSVDDIRRVNVHGSETLLRSAADAGVPRLLVLSSMSAYEGTRQRYGRAKLEIERITLGLGGVAIRPGLVCGSDAGGMGATLASLTALPVTPVISGGHQFPVLESEFVAAVTEVLGAADWRSEVFGVAQPQSVSFRQLLAAIAAIHGQRCRMVPVPWRFALLVIRAMEAVAPSTPFRSDSLLGLVEPAASVRPSKAFPDLLDSLTSLDEWSSHIAVRRAT